MTTFYRVANGINALLVKRVGINPKSYYALMKHGAKRVAHGISGKPYGADAKSVNIILEDRMLLLCGIPKVATQTFLRELIDARRLGRSRIHSTHLADLLLEQPALQAFHKVAFVRNPWARVVSAYNSKICHPKYRSVRMYFLQYKGLSYRMPFDDFVRWLCQTPEGADNMADRHWVSQHLFLYRGGEPLVDRIGRLESLDEDFASVCEERGIPVIRLGNHSRKTTTGGASYRDYFSEETRALVAERYKKDIEWFGYEF